MIAIPVRQVKAFMNLLLCTDTFDNFHVPEITLQTHSTITIDGHLHPDYFSAEEYETLCRGNYPLARWRQFRPVCHALIRGRHAPLSFCLVLKYPLPDTNVFLSSLDTVFTAADVDGLLVNLRYAGGDLTAVTATSLRLFSLDKSLETAWDSYMQKFIFSLESL